MEMNPENICILGESTSAPLEIPKVNWTRHVYERQIFGSKFPLKLKKKTAPAAGNSQTMTILRKNPLREYRLSQIVMSPKNLEEVFLGFSLCGNYVYSYLEIPISNENMPYNSILATERTYLFHMWQFTPARKLKLAFRIKLFHGESFMESLNIRVQHLPDIPGMCVIIGNLTGSDGTTLTRTLWHSVLFSPPSSVPMVTLDLSFYALYALSSNVRPDGHLMITTCDELILMNLTEMMQYHRNGLQNLDPEVKEKIRDMRPYARVIIQDVGDISKAKLKGAHYFSYASQTLQWCTQDAEANLKSSYVGLSDYHLNIDELSDDTCDGCIFALYDVDTNERCYYESMYTFRWNLKSNTIERLSGESRDVTDRSKEPGRQQKAFDAMRTELFSKIGKPKSKYQISNSSVLEGYSLQRIFDATGCIALTL